MTPRPSGSPRTQPNLWPRRIITSAALLAIIALLVWGVVSIIRLMLGSRTPHVSQESAPQSVGVSVQSGDSTITLHPGQKATRDGIVSDLGVSVPRCSSRDLQVNAQVTSTGEGEGEKVGVSLMNTSEVACFTYAGSLSLTVLSGDQTIYDSAQCSDRDETATPLLLSPKDTWTGELLWDGTVYTQGCALPAGGSEVSGAGTYRAVVSLEGMRVTGEQVFVVY